MRRGFLPLIYVIVSAAVMLLTSSCATLSRNGVGRVKRYTVESEKLPLQFDGMRVAFLSDLHYPSLFTNRRLGKIVTCLNREQPDLLLLGGDYVTDNDSIDALFDALGSVETVYGICAVWGNHERCNKEQIAVAMQMNGIVLLEDSVVELSREDASIFLVGINNSFSCDSLSCSMRKEIPAGAFVIMLAHTPDYAERSSAGADVVLSGHTHGGQVSLFGIYTPVKNTAYGTRFLRGRNMTTCGSTVITTNGVGTSRRKVRFCVPSEVVVVTLKSIMLR